MAPHEERVFAEKMELDVKIDKLGAFIGGDRFSALSDEARELMERQLAFMRGYSGVLGERIDLF